MLSFCKIWQFFVLEKLYIYVGFYKGSVVVSHYLYDVAKSLGFGVRNEAKAMNDTSDSGVRAIVGGIQTIKAGTSIFEEVNKFDRVAKAASATAQYASTYVNPLLCVASFARVCGSQDKPSAAIEETCAMSSMFGVEALMKNQFKPGSVLAESKIVKSGAEHLGEVITKIPLLNKCKAGAVGSVLTGLAFIAGSISGYTLGHNVGENIADNTTRKYRFINPVPGAVSA